MSISSCIKRSGRRLPDHQWNASCERNTKVDFPSPVTLVPTYPDLPMEDVYPRTGDTDTRELYLREMAKAVLLISQEILTVLSGKS